MPAKSAREKDIEKRLLVLLSFEKRFLVRNGRALGVGISKSKNQIFCLDSETFYDY